MVPYHVNRLLVMLRGNCLNLAVIQFINRRNLRRQRNVFNASVLRVRANRCRPVITILKVLKDRDLGLSRDPLLVSRRRMITQLLRASDLNLSRRRFRTFRHVRRLIMLLHVTV